jgi:hypothetical protein
MTMKNKGENKSMNSIDAFQLRLDEYKARHGTMTLSRYLGPDCEVILRRISDQEATIVRLPDCVEIKISRSIFNAKYGWLPPLMTPPSIAP